MVCAVIGLIFAFLLIGRILKRVRPDVVHAWGTENGAALVAGRLGYPSVVTMQGLLTWLADQWPGRCAMRRDCARGRRRVGRWGQRWLLW